MIYQDQMWRLQSKILWQVLMCAIYQGQMSRSQTEIIWQCSCVWFLKVRCEDRRVKICDRALVFDFSSTNVKVTAWLSCMIFQDQIWRSQSEILWQSSLCMISQCQISMLVCYGVKFLDKKLYNVCFLRTESWLWGLNTRNTMNIHFGSWLLGRCWKSHRSKVNTNT